MVLSSLDTWHLVIAELYESTIIIWLVIFEVEKFRGFQNIIINHKILISGSVDRCVHLCRPH